MPSFAEIYSACLYTGGEGYPLWNPSPLRLGDVGYVRDGSFIVLYNAIDGPGRLSDAASIPLARRSDRSLSRERTHPDSAGVTSAKMDIDDPVSVIADPAGSSRRSSLATSSSMSPSLAPVAMSRSSASDSLLPSAAKKGSPTLSHRKLRSGTPPEGPYPPMPLSVDQEAPKLFDMGPRMSSNYRCLGLAGATTIPGSPVSVKIGFESSGGDGAILIPRDPTERTRLKYLGVLKAYIKAHHKWMYETYGRIEAIGIDDLAFIYGQDRTSDWAVAVSRDAARGAKVEFEIFGSASAGFWGNWSHTLSACQRGPHRAQGGGNGRNAGHVEAPVERRRESESSHWDVNLEGGVINPSFSFSASASNKDHDDDEHTRGRRRRTAPVRNHSITWTSDAHAAPDQTISIRRVTACTTPGLGFLPARPKAAAEPRDPDMDRDQGGETGAVARQDGGGQHDDDRDAVQSKPWCDDPLEALHEWIHHRPCAATIKVSIASDDDCLQLLSLLGREQVTAIGLQRAVRLAADRFASIAVDKDGFATVAIGHAPTSARKAASIPQTAPTLASTADKENTGQDMFAIARRAVAKTHHHAPSGLKPRAMLGSSSRFNTMLPCRPMSGGIGSASASLVLP
ncbi:conserved hypothetical Ustilaginaceae-specific protein [Sporisorium reilianum SRZ2]|uniref:Conserved hypothetical Ustilaginaceae-specific protein n=1 Tax=Sporisorium reilianum (strain SRZ2) TaxID=999809 RepID=E7A1F5_SPORE|nr:conserved hypothetical Ustilaginaceae-specific protein [Sporisorium reilianum SRZ2]